MRLSPMAQADSLLHLAMGRFANDQGTIMAISTILLIILILILLGALPSWPYSRGWGYYPSGTLGIVVVIVILLLLTGRI
jgi:hypothetical protein